ncbi:MGMT family protein [Maridesulfovibrio sp. FT414]|uniref:MGMT family protein n=1 Tax=Maridesulfovibrio sp. FT414 TaxID=2979469 RepID=UPI003D804423
MFTARVIEVLRRIPRGKIVTYGRVAALAGNPCAARQVVRVLHVYSKKEGLPWHRVLNREGAVSLERGHGYEEQRALLEREGIVFGVDDRVDLENCLWMPARSDLSEIEAEVL